MLTRYPGNPILEGDPDVPWRAIKVYNCSVYKTPAGLHQMLFRAVGQDWISRLGYAESNDGISFEVSAEPVLVPKYPWEAKGCEDPRLTKIDDRFWLSYTAFDGKTARGALTSSDNLKEFIGERKLLFPQWQHNARVGVDPDWSKGAAIFPQKIDGLYYMLFGDSHMWLATSENLSDWQPDIKPVLEARASKFDAVYVETGPPPILTERGWLILYHGVDTLGPAKTYRLSAALLDKNDPRRVLWRANQFILEPTETYEIVGFIDVIEGGFETLKTLSFEDLHHLHSQAKLPKAVFCCGATLEPNDTIRLYYGAGDTVICTATIDLESIFRL